MEWIRVEAGEYLSIDERFHIIKCWDRVRGTHWELWDKNTNEEYSHDSLKHCKQIAETLK